MHACMCDRWYVHGYDLKRHTSVLFQKPEIAKAKIIMTVTVTDVTFQHHDVSPCCFIFVLVSSRLVYLFKGQNCIRV